MVQGRAVGVDLAAGRALREACGVDAVAALHLVRGRVRVRVKVRVQVRGRVRGRGRV